MSLFVKWKLSETLWFHGVGNFVCWYVGNEVGSNGFVLDVGSRPFMVIVKLGSSGCGCCCSFELQQYLA